MVERRPSNLARSTLPVIGAPIDVLDWETALSRIEAWAAAHDSRTVCICNAHSVVTASRDPAFMRVLAEADMATPDGAPVAWTMRHLGATSQERISGPDLMVRYCERAARNGQSMFLYGATAETLALLQQKLRQQWPALRIVGTHAPPFRALTPAEDAAIVDQINASGAHTVWVGLGCPKQETWMAEHRGRVRAVMIGVGAAFDFHSGKTSRAPSWMRNNGLEWLHRLVSEPRRLGRRYLTTNAAFMWGAAHQLLRVRR